MGVWLWWSTGKDSAWMLQVLRDRPDVEVAGLVTTIKPAAERVAVHGTRLAVLRAQAEATGLPLRTIALPHPCPNEVYEAAVRPVLHDAAANGISHMAFGDLFLEDIRAYREGLFEDLPLQPLFPLWKRDTTDLARTMIDSGLEAVVTALDPDRLDRSFAGAPFSTLVNHCPASVDPCGENGAFHTCVTAGPMFNHDLSVERGPVMERDGVVYADLRLVDDGTAAS